MLRSALRGRHFHLTVGKLAAFRDRLNVYYNLFIQYTYIRTVHYSLFNFCVLIYKRFVFLLYYKRVLENPHLLNIGVRRTFPVINSHIHLLNTTNSITIFL